MLVSNVVFSAVCQQCTVFQHKPEQTRGVMKGKAGSERFLILPKSVVALY